MWKVSLNTCLQVAARRRLPCRATSRKHSYCPAHLACALIRSCLSARLQKLFSWNETEPLGVQAHASQVLWCLGREMEKGALGMLRREARAGEQSQKVHSQRKRLQDNAWQ